MSDEKKLLNRLIELGIQNPIQLEENDIFYWWQKKFREIKNNNLENRNELLININNAKEELENIDKADLIKILKNKSINKNRSNEIKEIKTKETKIKDYEDSDPFFGIIYTIIAIGIIAFFAAGLSELKQQKRTPSKISLRCRGCDEYSYLEKGNKNFDQRNFETAIEYYQIAIQTKKEKRFFLAEKKMASAQVKLGDYSSALNTYLKLNEKYPYDLIVLNEIQKVQTLQGKYQEAINTNLQIIKVGSRDSRAEGKKRGFSNWNFAIGVPLDVFTTIGDLELKNRNRLVACRYWRRTIQESGKTKNYPNVKIMREKNIEKINEWCRMRLDGGRIYSFD